MKIAKRNKKLIEILLMEDFTVYFLVLHIHHFPVPPFFINCKIHCFYGYNLGTRTLFPSDNNYVVPESLM